MIFCQLTATFTAPPSAWTEPPQREIERGGGRGKRERVALTLVDDADDKVAAAVRNGLNAARQLLAGLDWALGKELARLLVLQRHEERRALQKPRHAREHHLA